MGLNLGKLVGIGVGLATGNPALGAAAGSLFDSGGGGAAGGGGKGGAAQAFLASSYTAASEGKKELKDIQLRNAAATQKTAAIFKSYLEEKSPKDRPATGQKLYDISSNG